ncbi:hypothetical protein [Winogradskyella ouciana]|uniref:Uncharacterized protein n=1 Tax=Winogradskyella ouciana TaxID=2608631 RepID=A0A7K1GGF2_9FLAO|nr:hypothetical protein [Winogradskyella ouciana]MTE27544.1 hypothetical protein [Winogradskyella ouciana]
MTEEEYNKIARLFQYLNNTHLHSNYNYGGFNGNYRTYNIDDLDFPSDTFQLIDDLTLIRVQDFYNIDYLKSNNFPERFYNNPLVQKSDTVVGFHYQLPTILFYYLFNKLKKSAVLFLKFIETDEFKSNYSHLITRGEYDFEYPSVMHDELFKYLSSKIPNFGMFHHLLNWLSEMGYSSGSMTIYKTKRIENCIENLERFDFNNINISNQVL